MKKVLRRKFDDDVEKNHHSPIEFNDFGSPILKQFKKFVN